MFISRKEKDELQAIVQNLHSRVRDLEIETIWLKNKLYKSKDPAIASDKAAPWGYKKDGVPRKRPGPSTKVMEVAS